MPRSSDLAAKDSCRRWATSAEAFPCLNLLRNDEKPRQLLGG